MAANFIGQFVTILSVNKTRTLDGRFASIFCRMGTGVPIFLFGGSMNKTKHLVHGAMIAALYAVLTHTQNMILPETASFAIQFRASEALCVLAFFTPAAIPGLTVGCLVFNLTFAGALPLDWLVGSLATLTAAWGMRHTRGILFKNLPVPGLLMPAVTNAVLVGWELSVYVGGGFWVNALCVALGELGVLFTLGALLYRVMKKQRLDLILFG